MVSNVGKPLTSGRPSVRAPGRSARTALLSVVAAFAACGSVQAAAWADIVVPSRPNGVERYAAEELQYHLEKAFSTSFAVVSEDRLADMPATGRVRIYLGDTKAARAAGLPGRTLQLEERVLKTTGGALYLLGNDYFTAYDDILNSWATTSCGTLYAVYDFLEHELGVKWIWPGELGEVIPKRTTFALGEIDRSGIEPLEFRVWYNVVRESQDDVVGFTGKEKCDRFYRGQMKFLVRHRVGRRVNWQAKHAFEDWWGLYGREHPEYFNLLPGGVRRPATLDYLVTMCVSEPGVWRQAAANWKTGYDKVRNTPYAPPCMIVCCENDFAGLCQCANCRAWDAPDERFALNRYWNGSMTLDEIDEIRRTSGDWGLNRLLTDNRWGMSCDDTAVAPLGDRYANFYNHMLAEARKLEPAARAVGYAYENYLEAPKQTRLDPGVVIEFVPRSYYPYDRTESDFFRRHWAGWRAAGAVDMTLRPNYTLAGGNFPFDQGERILDDFAFAASNGMRGCFFDSLRGTWANHLVMTYALTRAFREPTHGYAAAREEVLSAFGAAREPVARYFEAISRHTMSFTADQIRRMAEENVVNGYPGGSHGNPIGFIGDFFDDAFFTANGAILDEAAAAASGDAEILARVDFLRKGLRDAELTRRTRLAQKAMDAAPGDVANRQAFADAFAEMNDYRASIEDDYVSNMHYEASRERGVNWPHAVRTPRVTQSASRPVLEVGEATQDATGAVHIPYALANGPAVVTLNVLTNDGRGAYAPMDALGVFGANLDATLGANTPVAGDGEIVWRPLRTFGGGRPALGSTKFVLRAHSLNNAPTYMAVRLAADPGDADRVLYFASAGDLPGGVLGNENYRKTILLMKRVRAKNAVHDAEWPSDYADSDCGGMVSGLCRAVSFENDFYMGVFELTQRQWREVCGTAVGPYFTVNGDMRPMESVSYREIRESSANEEDDTHMYPNPPSPDSFLGRLRALTRCAAFPAGVDFDLPSENEWEFTARAGLTLDYYNDGSPIVGGDENRKDNGFPGRSYAKQADPKSTSAASDTDNGTAVCGSYPASRWGFYDMSGNVGEWCLDWYERDLSGKPPVFVNANGRVLADGSTPGEKRVARGGSWACHDSYSRIYKRHSTQNNVFAPKGHLNAVGFRVKAQAGLK